MVASYGKFQKAPRNIEVWKICRLTQFSKQWHIKNKMNPNKVQQLNSILLNKYLSVIMFFILCYEFVQSRMKNSIFGPISNSCALF